MNGVCPETDIVDNAAFQLEFNADLAYQTLLNKIDEADYMKCGRGHNRFSIPNHNVLFPDVRICMPLVRGKKLFISKQLRELIWFASGMTDVAYLIRHGVHIWDNWVPAGKALYQTHSLQHRIELADAQGLLASPLCPRLRPFSALAPNTTATKRATTPRAHLPCAFSFSHIWLASLTGDVAVDHGLCHEARTEIRHEFVVTRDKRVEDDSETDEDTGDAIEGFARPVLLCRNAFTLQLQAPMRCDASNPVEDVDALLNCEAGEKF